MKYILTFIFFAFFGLASTAQSYTIDWSEMTSKQGRLVYLLPNKENDFYALRWVGSRILGSYQVSQHQGLSITQKGKIRLVAENSIANFEGARVIGEKFVIFLSDKQVGFNHFYMQEYDSELKPVSEPIRIASYTLDRSRKNGWFNVVQSANKDFFGVVWEVPGKKDERDLYGFKVFNNKLESVNEGEYPLPFDPRLSTIHAHHISNNGDYFMAVTEYSENETARMFKSHLNYKALHIYHIKDDGLQDFTLDLGGKRVEAMSMTSEDNNIFTITGLHGAMGVAGVKGVFHQQINLDTGEKINEGFKNFDKSFITQDWSERAIEKAEKREDRGKGDPQLYNYKMRDVTILKDGSIVGTMEQFYIQVRSNTDTRTGTMSQSYYYYYNDIIAYKINPAGEFDWVKKVKKYQVSTNDEGPYSSYASFIDNGKVYFIFNDHIRNYDQEGNFIDSDRIYTANYSRRKNTVALAEIDLSTGDMDRKTFFDRGEIDAIAVPKLFEVNYQTNEMLLYSIWGRKEKIGVLKFKK